VNQETINDRAKLMFHRLVARRLARDPGLVEQARDVVRQWETQHAAPKTYVQEWRHLLAQPTERIRRTITARSEDATRLRISSPFPLVSALAMPDVDTRRRLWRKAKMSVR
jgi:hypothetical protein